MQIIKSVLRYVFAAFFISAGVMHFANEPFYMKIMPDYIPLEWHRPAVHLSGIAEIVLGVLLWDPRTMRWAGWGLIALLIAVFPANIYLYQHPEIFPDFNPTMQLIRLPLQAVMIAWAWWYTRPLKSPAHD